MQRELKPVQTLQKEGAALHNGWGQIIPSLGKSEVRAHMQGMQPRAQQRSRSSGPRAASRSHNEQNLALKGLVKLRDVGQSLPSQLADATHSLTVTDSLSLSLLYSWSKLGHHWAVHPPPPACKKLWNPPGLQMPPLPAILEAPLILQAVASTFPSLSEAQPSLPSIRLSDLMYTCSFIHLTSLFLCQVQPHIRGPCLRWLHWEFIARTGLFFQHLLIYADSLLLGIPAYSSSSRQQWACIALLRPAGSDSPLINHSSKSVKFNFTSPFILR